MILSIQYLRALAAMMVVVFHAAEHLSEDFTFGGAHGVGAAGVDIFFVISGLIMWLTTAGRDMPPSVFLWRRVTRILPLYWIATLLMFAMPFVSKTIAGGVVADPAHLLASLFFIARPSPVDSAMYLPIYTPGWTINFEMFFYAIFALCLLARREMIRAAALTGALGGLALMGLAFSPGGLLGWYSSPIILEFAAGVLIGAAYTSRVRVPAWAAGAALLLGIAALISSGVYPAIFANRALIWGIPAALIVFGALFLERHGKIKVIPALGFFGDASYSLYLSHLFAVGAVAVVWQKFDLWPGAAGALGFMGLAIAASLALAALTYIHIEKPLLALSRLGWKTRKRPVLKSGHLSNTPARAVPD